jgi:GWxTD domain-containing protein
MNEFRRSILPLLLTPLLVIAGRSQTEFLPQNTFVDGPVFTVEALCFAADDGEKSRLDVYVDVGYDVLHFVNEANVYRASYEVGIAILDTLNKPVNEKSWLENIQTPAYDKSVSPKESNLSQRSFDITPGNYVVRVQITDDETKKSFAVKRHVNVRHFQKSRFVLSDIMLVNSMTLEGEKRVIAPNISGDVGGLKEGVILFFEAYCRLALDSTTLFVSVLNNKREVVASDSFMQKLTGPRTPCFHTVATKDLGAGDYFVTVEAHPRQVNGDGSVIEASSTTSHVFVIRWKGIPASILDLDAAINQMIYIVDKDRLEKMKSAPPERKKELFVEFWRKKDPSPGTERNELMDEYYARVEFANKHFSHFMDGWKSDMGMVFIIFGTPSNVERHPFDSDAKPYEIWTYYELNRQFVFIDQSGFGDYHLQNPIWDVWSTRPR